MFAEEKPSLLALPLEPFRYYQYGERVVHLDGCVEVEAAYYGLPPGTPSTLLRFFLPHSKTAFLTLLLGRSNSFREHPRKFLSRTWTTSTATVRASWERRRIGPKNTRMFRD
jgi:hypothetical protein